MPDEPYESQNKSLEFGGVATIANDDLDAGPPEPSSGGTIVVNATRGASYEGEELVGLAVAGVPVDAIDRTKIDELCRRAALDLTGLIADYFLALSPAKDINGVVVKVTAVVTSAASSPDEQ